MLSLKNTQTVKLDRLLEYNENLKEQLEMSRITISEASESLIEYCNETKDPLIPSVWGTIEKKEDPFAVTYNRRCCTIM